MGTSTQRGWPEWLKDVEAIELKHPARRIVRVSIPGGVPEIGWNVENNTYRGHSKVGINFANMRMGVFCSFHVDDGPFSVKFNDGEVVHG